MSDPREGADRSDAPYMIVSSDTHAGLFVEDYRPYLESSLHPEFDEWLVTRHQHRTMVEEVNGEYVEAFVTSQSRRELKPYLEWLFADPAVVTRQLVEDVLRYKRLDGVTEALRKVADAAFPDGRQAVRVHVPEAIPTLVVWGEDDRIIPAAHAANAPAHARVELLHGQGHSPHLEGSGDVTRLIDEFLSRT